MIAKEIPTPKGSNRKRVFKKCIEYITRPDRLDNRIAPVIENSIDAETITDMIDEMQLVADQNKRSKKTPLHHVVLSFHDSDIEGMDADALQSFVRTRAMDAAKAIGLENHQYVAALHSNTDHPHIHIAINKIDPERYVMNEPYYSQKRLMEHCQDVEQRLGLVSDFNDTKSKAISDKSRRFEAANGIKSLETFLQDNVALDFKDSLPECKNWQDVHAIFAAYSLVLKPRGAGLTIVSEASATKIKASALSRDCSKAKLEKMFGEFEPAGQMDHVEIKKAFTFEPTNLTKNEALFQEYKNDEIRRSNARDQIRDQLKEIRNQESLIWQQHTDRTRELRAKFSRQNLRDLLKQNCDVRESRLSDLTPEKQRLRGALKDNDTKTLSWKEWLVYKANNGHKDAKKALEQSDYNDMKNKKDAKNDSLAPEKRLIAKHKVHQADLTVKRDLIREELEKAQEERQNIFDYIKERQKEIKSTTYSNPKLAYQYQKPALDELQKLQKSWLEESQEKIDSLRENLKQFFPVSLLDFVSILAAEGDEEAAELSGKLIAKDLKTQRESGLFGCLKSITEGNTLVFDYDSETRVKITDNKIDIDNIKNIDAMAESLAFVASQGKQPTFSTGSPDLAALALRASAELNQDITFDDPVLNKAAARIQSSINNPKSEAERPKQRDRENDQER